MPWFIELKMACIVASGGYSLESATLNSHRLIVDLSRLYFRAVLPCNDPNSFSTGSLWLHPHCHRTG